MALDIAKIEKDLEISLVDKGQDKIDLWKQFYQGSVDGFHSYEEGMGVFGKQTRERYSLGMAKTGCGLWADSTWNPETFVLMGDEDNQAWLDNKLESLDFTNNFNALVEMYFALGMGATVQYLSEDVAETMFLYTDAVYPISYHNEEVVDCLFVNTWGNDYIWVQLHQKQEDGSYTITNRFYTNDDEQVQVPIEEVGDIEKEFYSDVKLFQIYKPAIVNNISVGSPIGISVYANAIDELKMVDQAFDGLKSEIVNGKLTVYIKDSAIKYDTDGEKTRPIVDLDQTAYHVMPNDDTFEDGTFLKVSSPELRVMAYVDALNRSMNLFGTKIGLGDNQFASDQGTIYTNTAQVISTNSKFFKTRKKHCSIVETGIRSMVRALYYLDFGAELDDTVSVQFDDSIIHDDVAENNKWLNLLNLGYINRVTYFENTLDMTRDEAKAFVEQQNEGIEEEVEFE